MPDSDVSETEAVDAESRREMESRLMAARVDEAWNDSIERQKYHKWRIVLASGVVFLTALIVFVYSVRFAATNPGPSVFEALTLIEFWDEYVFGAIFFAAASSGVAFQLSRRLRRSFQSRLAGRLLISELRGDLRRAETAVVSDGSDFASLWLATQKRFDYYHTVALEQSRASFRYGQLAAAAGFSVIAIAALVAAVVADSTASAVVIGLLGVSGGGLGAYIGATFMRSQQSTSAQLLSFFAHPLELSRLLAIERLLADLDAGPRAAAIHEITVAIATQQRPSEGSSRAT